MTQIDTQQLLPEVLAIAKAAGMAIMQIYGTEFDIENKADNSPLTQADLAANHIILNALHELTPKFPIISEESEAMTYETRKDWQLYWLIDPLDGTREFVKRNGEFTVNIALIQDGQAILGVVYAPATEMLYFAAQGQGAYKQLRSEPPQKIAIKSFDIKHLKIAGSRSHADYKTQNFYQSIAQHHGRLPEVIPMGSSLKICLVADGTVDLYPRLGPTFEWDTAAGHCVLREAGGDIIDEHGQPLHYNQRQTLLNPFFFATNQPDHSWAQYL